VSKSKQLTKSIIDTAYKLLINKLAHGGVVSKNEGSFQMELGYLLKTIGQLYEFKKEDKFNVEFESYINLNNPSIKSKSTRARVDILMEYQTGKSKTKAAIELKFLKKENHREPNNRYDVFKDLSNLELYRLNNLDICYFILATDHPHYVSAANYSKATGAFDFRNGKSYKKGNILKYNTRKPYGGPIKLTKDYYFKWNKVANLYFLKIVI
jgi:hypothetical protein